MRFYERFSQGRAKALPFGAFGDPGGLDLPALCEDSPLRRNTRSGIHDANPNGHVAQLD